MKLQGLHVVSGTKIWLYSRNLTKWYVVVQAFLLDFVISEMQDNSN